MTKLQRIVVTFVALGVIGAGALGVQSTRALEARLEACGGNDPANKVRASFDIPTPAV